VGAEYKHKDLTGRIIGAAYEVHKVLGGGFLEKVYENTLAVELSRCGLAVQQQAPIEVRYKGEVVGAYVADLVVDEKVLVETKAAASLEPVHYLKGTGLEVGLLINFGTEVQIKRLAFTHQEKT
jgi:GxxExxY protein